MFPPRFKNLISDLDGYGSSLNDIFLLKQRLKEEDRRNRFEDMQMEDLDRNRQVNELFQTNWAAKRDMINERARLESNQKPNVVINPQFIPNAPTEPTSSMPLAGLGGSNAKLADLMFKREALDKNLDFKRDVLSQKDESQGDILDFKRDQLSQKTTNDQTMNTIRQSRADTYRFKAMNPDWKPFVSKGGNLFYVNPQNPTEIMDTGIDTGTMSDQEKQDLIGEQRLEQIGLQGLNQATTQAMRGTQALEQIGARAAETRETNAAKPTRGELPTQTKSRLANKARELVNKRQDLAKYIIFNSDNTFTLKKNTPQDIADKINEFIYGYTSNEPKKDPAGIR